MPEKRSKKPTDTRTSGPGPIEFPKGTLTEEVWRKVRERAAKIPVVIEPDRDYSLGGLLEELSGSSKVTGHTDRYIFLEGDYSAVDRLDAHPHIFRVWLDKEIRAHTASGSSLQDSFGWLVSLDDSIRTTKVDAVWRSFGAVGKGIHWAILDSGIHADHRGFGEDGAGIIVNQDDTTGEGIEPSNLHGTHVAGILGQIAPNVRIHSYKVLGAQGGTTSMVVRAMHKIRETNDESLTRSGRLAIHGVNMSLGGFPDVESWAVGWSPESREVARLVRQGCLVVVSAGNEGYQQFATVSRGQVQIFPNFVPASIGDPGVAEEAITVGSTHRKYPWRYGVSFFSSKGPTGDGRQKPDLVAPGEKIASFDDKGGTIKLSGTSMAAPHVSGVLALFLSHFQGFQGRAIEVKKSLLETCSSLGRDPSFQGSGLVDAYRFFQAT